VLFGHAAHGLTTRACEAMRYWGFECWLSHASLQVCFWLSVQAVKCCSHLAWPCKVPHNWGGKSCITLIGQSRDARPESGDTIEVRKCAWSQDIWPESYLLTGVGHTTRVVSSDRSQAYDQSRVFRLKSCIRPELRLLTGVVIYLHYNHV
jgi:hypothetical protein